MTTAFVRFCDRIDKTGAEVLLERVPLGRGHVLALVVRHHGREIGRWPTPAGCPERAASFLLRDSVPDTVTTTATFRRAARRRQLRVIRRRGFLIVRAACGTPLLRQPARAGSGDETASLAHAYLEAFGWCSGAIMRFCWPCGLARPLCEFYDSTPFGECQRHAPARPSASALQHGQTEGDLR